MIERRVFLREGSLAVVGFSMVPGFFQRALLAAQPRARRKTLVVIFQRGGADGLNMVVPFGEKAYYEHRPGIAVPAPGSGDGAAIDLDGFFGLHPSLRPLTPLYKEGRLGIINAVGSPDTGGRSHFQAQDFMESAAPGNKTVSTGWLNRYLQIAPDDRRTPLRATAIGESLPKALRGPAPALTLAGLEGFGLAGGEVYESMYSRDANALLTGTARDMFDAARQLKAARPEQYQPRGGVNYPGAVGAGLLQVAQLIKADVGLQVAFVDVSGGWDTHTNEAAQLPPLLGTLAQALAAFTRDLGDRMQDIVVLTMSEFGRTARENGNGGTDHGHANVMFVMGGPVKGGKVYGTWPGLAREQLNEDRDLKLTTDFRDVLGELLVGHLGCEKPDAVFPQYAIDPKRFIGIV
ncbi:MAG: DUF1501 domain-containing protein [Acidobacteriota bacterium]